MIPLKLVENGKATAGIFLPDDATPRERFAAKELCRYVRQISGVTLPYGKALPCRVFIGSPERHKGQCTVMTAEAFRKSAPGPEGMMIYADEKALLLAGSDDSSERGTVYAVYVFLERFLGCSLATYSGSALDAGEIVPKTDTITLPDIFYAKPQSDVPYRAAIMQYSVWAADPDHALNLPFIDWLAKNRYNRIVTWASVYEGFKKNGVAAAAEKRGIAFSVGHHEAMRLFLPPEGNAYFPEHYYATHPEYYKLCKDGSRYRMRDGEFLGQLTLCMRNENGVRQFAENVITWARKNPQADVIMLWPGDDADDGCCCAQCRQHDKNENYTYFVNRVADIVNAVLPHLRFDRIAYMDLYHCDGQKSSRNVIVDEAVWIDGKMRHVGDPDGSGYADTVFEKELLLWKQTGARVVYYDYFMGNYNAKQRYMPLADEMQAVCKRFAEKGIDGLGTQVEVYNIWNNILNYYAYGRTAYDTALSFSDILSHFCRLFGDGGDDVRRAILLCEQTVNGQTEISEAGIYLMQHIDKETVYAHFDNALAAAKEKRERNNIRLLRMAFRYSDLEVVNRPQYNQNGKLTDSMDKNGELWYMHAHFDSFTSKNEGAGIAVPVLSCDTVFVPDSWYQFE